MSNLAKINQLGQSVWLDNLSRNIIQNGELSQFIQQHKVTGVTSNPAIFFKSFSNDKLYSDDVAKVKQLTNVSLEQRYEGIVIQDIQACCDLLKHTYVASNKKDGFVSLELSPEVANNTLATIENALRLSRLVNRDNLMIKIPATKEGIEALEELTYLGLNINITLLFSISQVEKTWNAYIRGIKRRSADGKTLTNRSVASFFLSRIDALLDPKLSNELKGKVAIAIARVLYDKYQKLFHTDDFAPLLKSGATGQYLLWASTATKDPNYSDVMYIEELIGADTVNTIPDNTLKAFIDHGNAASRLTNNVVESYAILDAVKKDGFDLEYIGATLQKDGLAQFETAFASLLELLG